MFRDRQQAGQELGVELQKLCLSSPIVLALPGGGVCVAAEIAKALKAQLDIVIVRKVGAPRNHELTVAAIVDGDPPDVVLDRTMVKACSLDDDALSVLIANERPELERRRAILRGKRQALSIAGKTAIIVDDGVATGATMKVAIRALKRRSPRDIVVALPVAPTETLTQLAQEADWTVCLSQPDCYRTLSQHYLSFPQVPDDEVVSVIADAARREGARRRGEMKRFHSCAAGELQRHVTEKD